MTRSTLDFPWYIRELPYVLVETRGALPADKYGLYVVYTADGEMLYGGKVGKDGTDRNVRDRWQGHALFDTLRADAASRGVEARIAWMASEAPEAFLYGLERLIAVLDPGYNKQHHSEGEARREARMQALAVAVVSETSP
jgi:hypothetical protein